MVPHHEYSATALIILRAAKLLRKQNNPNYEQILHLLSFVNPNLLSDEPWQMEFRGKMKTNQSDKEQYYSLLSRALLETGNYKECIKACDDAFKSLDEFHNDNDIWLEMRRGEALLALGQAEEARRVLTDIIPYHNHWALRSRLARAHAACDETDEALFYYLQAALSDGPMGMKTSLFAEMADFLMDLDKIEAAKDHAELSLAIRKNEGWGLSRDAAQLAEKFEVNPDSADFNAAMKRCRNAWLDFLYSLPQARVGYVARIGANNRFGFIEDNENNNSYYFSFDSVLENKPVTEGDVVQYCLVPAYDRKKDVVNESAAFVSKM